MSETCDFCGSKLVRKELLEAGQMPELIIPFFITPQEAKKRMLMWGHKHEDTQEGRSIVAAIIRFVDISGTSELFFNHFRPEYGAAWYVLAGFVVATLCLACIFVNPEGKSPEWSDATYVENEKIKPENEGKLVAISGHLKVVKNAKDDLIGVSFPSPKVKRYVEKLIWDSYAEEWQILGSLGYVGSEQG